MLEFMSCGRPVILGVNGEAQRILENSRSGIHIAPEDPDALCSAILRLSHHPSMCEAFGRNGREYIVENLSRKHTSVGYLDVLRGLLQSEVHFKAAA
jgi:glycosyltransferase involved in cell wall biosynthesis